MNIQSMMKQAQKIQQEMKQKQNKIDQMEFIGESSMVKVKVNGKKEILEVNIDQEILNSEDQEMLQDMIVVATNNALQQVDEITNKELGKYTKQFM